MSHIIDEILHSDAPVVVIEAAAGCGKTWTAAKFARETSSRLEHGRVLLLSHTHAACGEFHKRCQEPGLKVDVETCDSFALKVVGPYAHALGLPHPLDLHLGRANEGVEFSVLSEKAVELFRRAPTIARVIAGSYPTIILDEHQDSSRAQHQMIMLLREIGASRIRAFGDPMQAIHPDDDAGYVDWSALLESADDRGMLEEPHRWRDARELGDWIKAARKTLKTGNPLSLADAPQAVRLERHSALAGRHRFTNIKTASRTVHAFLDRGQGSAAALAFLGPMVKSLAQICAWRARINEGASLEHLDELIGVSERHAGDPQALAHAFLDFLGAIGSGLGSALKSGLKARLRSTIDLRRAGALQQAWLRVFPPIYAKPDHRGLSLAMTLVHDKPPHGFTVRLPDHGWTLLALGRSEDPRGHLSSLGRQRRRWKLSDQTVSTIHKAKGLEFQRVLLCPVDKHQYPPGRLGARLLYVGLSRASATVDLAINETAPTEHLNFQQ